MRCGSILSGGGNAYFEGSMGIGNSPSRQEFNFNVTLGPTSNLIVEIGGTDPLPPEFDQFVFLQNFTLQGGALTIDLISLDPDSSVFSPQAGDSFQIIEVHQTWSGTFGTYNLPTLSGRLAWDLSQLYSHGTIGVFQVIPEPSGGMLLGIICCGIVIRYRRRSAN